MKDEEGGEGISRKNNVHGFRLLCFAIISLFPPASFFSSFILSPSYFSKREASMFVRMEVVGLALDEQTKVPLIILRDEDEKYILPIWIGALEAVAISMPLNGVILNRPMTHDLFLNTLETLGVRLEYIEITEIKDSTYFAEIVFLKDEERFRIDSRPSDAIALALRARAPIMVSQKVLDEIEQIKRGDYQVVLQDEESKRWAEVLEKYNLEDIKYKM